MSGIFLLILFYALGTLVAYVTNNFFPPSVWGMILLFVALQTKVVKEEKVKNTCSFLINNMILFFLPVGVAILWIYPTVSNYLTPIVGSIVLSTAIIIVVTALLAQKMDKRGK